jgi:hypothetical protein
LLDEVLQSTADRPAERRLHDRADRARHLADQIAEKPIEFLLVADPQQLGREFDLG